MKARLKRIIRAMLLPAWRRIGPRFYSRVDTRIALYDAGLNARVSELEAGWQQHLPAFLNAVSTVRSFGHELAQAQTAARTELAQATEAMRTELRGEFAAADKRVWSSIGELNTSVGAAFDRVEFVRREILFEMKHGRYATTSPADDIVRQILSPDKVAAARANGGLRLNLGCGHIALPDYVNVDQRELPGVDVVAEVGDLPFDTGTVHEVFSAHLLEHFPQEELIRRLLPYWHELLIPGGVFRAVVPDGQAMLDNYAAGTYPFPEFREVLFGAQDYEGDFHFNLLTPDSLRELLEQRGFRQIEVPARGRRNGKCFEFEVRAVK